MKNRRYCRRGGPECCALNLGTIRRQPGRQEMLLEFLYGRIKMASCGSSLSNASAVTPKDAHSTIA